MNAGAIKVKKNRLARQYMNRRGGFNRPLPAERTGEKVGHLASTKSLKQSVAEGMKVASFMCGMANVACHVMSERLAAQIWDQHQLHLAKQRHIAVLVAFWQHKAAR